MTHHGPATRISSGDEGPGAGAGAGLARAPEDPTARAVRVARGSLGRYRVLAYVTGVMLLVLCLEMILKYLLNVDVRSLAWVPFAHGWVYVVYLATVVDLWSKMRWGFRRLIAMVLAGVVPVMSFLLEKPVHRDAAAKISAAERAAAASGLTAQA